MTYKYFEPLIKELTEKAASAAINQLGFANQPLRAHLEDLFVRDCGDDGSFIGTPVFEATFGWELANETLESLAPTLLHPKLISALDSPKNPIDDKKKVKADYRFGKDAKPYSHQLKAWKKLSEPEKKSVIITSGTGSGKTECFMIPILNDLVKESYGNARDESETPSQLVGVRALFLYPLNALIESQKERLSAWTGPFNDKIRFCLYNGNTDEISSSERKKEAPEQIVDRETLRDKPSPILVTNATMLEYMLVRAQDSAIMSKSSKDSKGTLRWIVLDEAHSYIGSQAAELSLLLRRVLLGFNVDASDVRFIATSATMGDGQGEELKKFISDIAGVDEQQVYLITGNRTIPVIQKPNKSAREYNFSLAQLIKDFEKHSLLNEITEEKAGSIYNGLVNNKIAWAIRDAFTNNKQNIKTPEEVLKLLKSSNNNISIANESTIIQWLDLLSLGKAPAGRSKSALAAFLPLRLHLFHNILPGLWACSDSHCSVKPKSLNEVWEFGKVFTQSRSNCECGAPVFEMRSCNDCNEIHLWAQQSPTSVKNVLKLSQIAEEAPDEFRLDVEIDDETEFEQKSEKVASLDSMPVFITNQKNGAKLQISRSNSHIGTKAQDDYTVTVFDNEFCPYCESGKHIGDKAFRTCLLSAPFFLKQLVPILLERCPAGVDAENKPFSGKRMITFTDSRQGTARMSASLQQDAERNFVRSIIYRKTLDYYLSASELNVDKIENELFNLESADKNLATCNPGTPEYLRVAGFIEKIKEELKVLRAPQPISFEELVSYMGHHEADVKTWAYLNYKNIDNFFASNDGQKKLAKLFLIREFMRRPKRANNLETMGLISTFYPTISNVKLTRKVTENSDFTISEWRDFLKICIDYFIRGSGIVELDMEMKKWLGSKYSTKHVARWDVVPSKAQMSWPQNTTASIKQNRLARMLALALGYNFKDSAHQDKINFLLQEAFDQLCNTQTLKAGDGGYYLELSKISFIPVTNAWFCPVTRRVLDTTLRGFSPYQKISDSKVKCQNLVVPLPPSFVNRKDLNYKQVVKDWLVNSSEIQLLKKFGVWSDLSDKIVEGVRYYRTAEHSAQQSSVKLSHYEDDFKDGNINILNCSTTMEMGVDIGGLSVVAMNNTPPHPANYLQRAGRAGRRGETRSLALTVCKNNPHDQMVFANPRWAFDTKLKAPSVHLDSHAIVQRHVNSLLLSIHLNRLKQKNPTLRKDKLDMAWWTTSLNDSTPSPVKAFECWLDTLDLASENEADTKKSFNMLLKRTCYEGESSFPMVIKKASFSSSQCLTSWVTEIKAIDAQLSKLEKDSPAATAFMYQRSRLSGEYLLRELAASGFLPSFGFPTNISSFDTNNISSYKSKVGSQKKDREDNKMRSRDLPSRSAVSALGEYSPGAKIVIDGLVYESAGITLNWHAPASEVNVQEIQSMRSAWRCVKCGSSGTAGTAENIKSCPDCNAALGKYNSEENFTYLQPSGFSVDFYEPVDNDISTQTFTPVELPWINTNSQWMPLANPNLGKFRASPNGTAFYFTKGMNHTGFSICLECGRAEPSLSDQTGFKHTPLSNHRRLRGSKKSENECTGNVKDFSIKKHLRLGHEIGTDVLEIQLNDINGKPLVDPIVAYSISVALRGAICRKLGVEFKEICCTTKPILLPNGSQCFSIVLHDEIASGYCSSINDSISELLVSAKEILECVNSKPGACHTACQHCLLSYDTRFRVAEMDRVLALNFLSASWLSSLNIPSIDAFWGVERSQPEFTPLSVAISNFWSKPSSEELRVYLPDNLSNWDISTWVFKKDMLRISSKSNIVRIVLPNNYVDKTSMETKIELALLAQSEFVKISTRNTPLAVNGGNILAQVINNDSSVISWATRDLNSLNPNDKWGISETNIFVRTSAQNALPITSEDESTYLKKLLVQSNLQYFEIGSELNGKLNNFGQRLVNEVTRRTKFDLAMKSDQIVDICYSDRYLGSPLSVMLLFSFLKAIKNKNQHAWTVPNLIVKTSPIESPHMRSSFQVHHNWSSDNDRKNVIDSSATILKMTSQVNIFQKQNLEHGRVLSISMQSGEVFKIRLDQGFGFWKSKGTGRSVSFEFSLPTQKQAELVIKADGYEIENPENLNTLIYLEHIRRE